MHKRRYSRSVYCRDCATAEHRGWINRNRAHIAAYTRNRDYGRKYGLTTTEVEQMIAEQDGACPICERKFDEMDRARRPHVDHNHALADKYEAVRSVLCDDCNVMIGRAHDNPSVLRAAAEYLSA